MECTFTIDGSLIGLNDYINAERTNKFRAAQIKKDETWKVFCYSKNCIKSANFDKQSLYDISIHWFEKDNKKDADNITFGIKAILDGIVKSGIIENDSRKFIRNIFHFIHTDKLKPRIEVTLKSII